ncbi:MAG: hypothetical protein IGR93_15505 [Hydrococcus sp. C42_A2020_068]|uniref:Glutamine synthetase n=1 Tax=Hydrococcus rivularis NIES-593 TaxID=1921803 RepID=A0A1U7HEG6_9CYAN|nr:MULTISPECIES: hypothetical protein [Pleurocapsales]AFY77806.1 hypothetical protein Ple7327_2515 [Pleurocapsa sp. PCC 7327]MBF2021464.1 hypothetical protein [Hydrococcus sp. C42_A2020_068]OKH21987.1 hypothetical protein NIES593_13695 [Hydrococcus rivularis NIES-593]
MSIETQARALLMRHHRAVVNREQSMLLRIVNELGVDIDVTHYHSHIQGKTPSEFSAGYDRTHASMS